MPEKKAFERLPKTVLPKHYYLELKPDLKAFTFTGKTKIDLEVASTTNSIKLNSAELDLKTAELVLENGKTVVPKISYVVEDETATFTFPDVLSTGKATLNIEFTGELNDKLRGFYRSKYAGKDGQTSYAAVTQFEATDARRCFPCWDEPAHKATFDITLTVPKSLVALSNMTVKNEKVEGDHRVVQFNTTPVMSTYLVAVVVGEYDYIEDTSEDGVLVRVYTPVGKQEQGRYALEVATKVLPYYKDYFQIAYPLPKIDLIAIADFSAGAMENWGLVTYRETAILIDPKNSSAQTKQWVALTVGHEIAHQWFGNLVTMEWWSDLWLNEGYASFVEFLCVNHIFPDYDIWTQFVTETLISALDLDSLASSHAIEVPVGHPSEVDEIFDEISYSKGASVIRMLHNYMGDEDFRKGMNIYLTKNQYKNTFTKDLWTALEQASGKPIGAVMSTWTQQVGFPMVSVTAKQEGFNRVLTLTQEKFCADGRKDDKNTQWMVPITVSTSKNPKQVALSTMLDTPSTTLTIPNTAEGEWVKINSGTVGYYRVKYTPEMLRQLEPAIRSGALPPLDRLGLLDDLFAMVKAGHCSTVQVLQLLEAFTEETNYTVWSSVTHVVLALSGLMSHTDLRDAFDAYALRVYKQISRKVSWEGVKGESHLDTLLRSLVLNRLVALNDDGTVKEAKTRFENYLSSKAPLVADLRNVCYRAVLQDADEKTFNNMLAEYRKADLHEEKVRILRALGVIKNPELLSKVLQFSLSEEVRTQDTVFVVISVASNPAGRELAWKFFQDNFKLLNERYSGGFLLTRLVKYCTDGFACTKKAEVIEQFFKEHPVPGAERTVQQSIETIHLTAGWLKRDVPAIREFLKTH
ncbi:puromycin-sensitive aminopeptidase [Ctenocephalides felis]|uniref:puromycin-sensitive aminopeptidase n=1 Tax=Ctenocephalides felis TaxID=7515 RepID=UPI000E6E3A7E|nr:puromycin-sensitive aminopeptidase [Ctenocephalides felis]